MRRMDPADDLLPALHGLEQALARADARLAEALAQEHSDRQVRDALYTDAERLRDELARQRRAFAAQMAAQLRVEIA
jgi:hypothetical protein